MRLRTLGLTALLLLVSAPTWAGITVSPAYIQVSLDKGRPSGRFDITNLGDEVERYRVRALHYRYTEMGGLIRLKPDPKALSAWIKFNPAEVTIPPKTRRVVRFVILPRGRLAPGEYWAAMELENLSTTVGESTDEAGRTLKIEVVSSVMVPIFGTVGEVVREGTLDTLAAKPDPEQGTVIETHLTNRGTGRLLVKGTYEIMDGAGKVVADGQIGYAYILPASERHFTRTVEVPLPAGQYTVAVEYESPQLDSTLAQQTTLTLAKPSTPPTEEGKKTDAKDKGS